MSADFWAGYLSGAASIVVGNPLDLIKVRLQASTSKDSVHLRPWQSFKTLAAGLPAPILTHGALNALLFFSYNRTLNFLSTPELIHDEVERRPLHHLGNHFVAGSIAGCATFFISTPTEYIKCRAQMLNADPSLAATTYKRNNSSLTIAIDTIRQRGFKGLFLGGTVTAIRDAVGYGFWFATYEASKILWDRQRAARDGISPAGSFEETARILQCGGLAGVATWASVFPLDVVKTRVQTQQLGAFDRSAACTTALRNTVVLQRNRQQCLEMEVQPRGAIFMARKAYAQEGFRVFFRGLGVCCLRAFIVNAVQWTVYEWAMRSLSGTADA